MTKLDKILEKYAAPENCNMLLVPKVNEEIWLDLIRSARSTDLNLQGIQKYIVDGISAVA